MSFKLFGSGGYFLPNFSTLHGGAVAGSASGTPAGAYPVSHAQALTHISATNALGVKNGYNVSARLGATAVEGTCTDMAYIRPQDVAITTHVEVADSHNFASDGSVLTALAERHNMTPPVEKVKCYDGTVYKLAEIVAKCAKHDRGDTVPQGLDIPLAYDSSLQGLSAVNTTEQCVFMSADMVPRIYSSNAAKATVLANTLAGTRTAGDVFGSANPGQPLEWTRSRDVLILGAIEALSVYERAYRDEGLCGWYNMLILKGLTSQVKVQARYEGHGSFPLITQHVYVGIPHGQMPVLPAKVGGYGIANGRSFTSALAWLGGTLSHILSAVTVSDPGQDIDGHRAPTIVGAARCKSLGKTASDGDLGLLMAAQYSMSARDFSHNFSLVSNRGLGASPTELDRVLVEKVLSAAGDPTGETVLVYDEVKEQAPFWCMEPSGIVRGDVCKGVSGPCVPDVISVLPQEIGEEDWTSITAVGGHEYVAIPFTSARACLRLRALVLKGNCGTLRVVRADLDRVRMMAGDGTLGKAGHEITLRDLLGDGQDLPPATMASALGQSYIVVERRGVGAYPASGSWDGIPISCGTRHDKVIVSAACRHIEDTAPVAPKPCGRGGSRYGTLVSMQVLASVGGPQPIEFEPDAAVAVKSSDFATGTAFASVVVSTTARPVTGACDPKFLVGEVGSPEYIHMYANAEHGAPPDSEIQDKTAAYVAAVAETATALHNFGVIRDVLRDGGGDVEVVTMAAVALKSYEASAARVPALIRALDKYSTTAILQTGLIAAETGFYTGTPPAGVQTGFSALPGITELPTDYGPVSKKLLKSTKLGLADLTPTQFPTIGRDRAKRGHVPDTPTQA